MYKKNFKNEIEDEWGELQKLSQKRGLTVKQKAVDLEKYSDDEWADSFEKIL